MTPPYIARLEAAWAAHQAPRAADAPTVISTFAGAGGSSLGYSIAGFRELLAVEREPKAVATFRANFPEVPVFAGDVQALTAEELLARTGLIPGQLDVFDGSPPCQGFSVAGGRQLDDPRNQLFRDYTRLLTALQPRAFVMENVPGMVRGSMRLIFVEILRELKACGYQVKAAVLNAADYGVPQSRQRMIFLGIREDLGLAPSFPDPLPGPPITVRQAIGHLPLGREGTHNRETIRAWQMCKPGQALRKVVRYVGSMQSYRLDPDRPSYTQTSSHLHWHYGTARKVTIEEAALLMSFPPGFQFPGGKDAARTRIGNAVAPLFMAALAAHIKGLLRPATR